MQLRLEVRDGGLPRKAGLPYLSSYVSLRVVVDRNAGDPIFIPSVYTAVINEHKPTGEDLTIITLTDPDGDVRSFLFAWIAF
ncbi:hypothetical protein DPMN_025792 [Dreissena polymorpha]|uniref:Cadherin domain-containing protein n=1 Tax=Dreissena polymorpha TaxID=45954 RepID=A0A9D4RDM8_DREPO|nr:hypothetical protein DPMN_025792 [Dreissena polymorpha]